MKTLIFILDVTAAPHQSQRRTEEASAGLHRIAVVNVLGELLEAGCPVMDGQLLALAVPGRLTTLFFQFPWNSILQGSLCKFFLVSYALLENSVRFDSFLVSLLSRFLGNNSKGFIEFLSYFVWKNT